MSTESDNVKSIDNLEKGSKKAYTRPVLSRYGLVQELTAGGSPGMKEDLNPMMGEPKPGMI